MKKVLEQGDSILVRVIASSIYRGFELSGLYCTCLRIRASKIPRPNPMKGIDWKLVTSNAEMGETFTSEGRNRFDQLSEPSDDIYNKLKESTEEVESLRRKRWKITIVMPTLL